MRLIPYENLSELSSDEVEEITRSLDSFAILADTKTGGDIVAFLNNQKDFISQEKTLFNRLRYLWKGTRGFSIVPFVTIWNKAYLNGFVVDEVVENASNFEICFSRRRR